VSILYLLLVIFAFTLFSVVLFGVWIWSNQTPRVRPSAARIQASRPAIQH
jgi:hypothetical protein